MNKYAYLIILITIITANCHRDGLEHKIEDIVYVTNADTIRGSLLVPKIHNNSTVVLIISGSGPTDRNGNQPRMHNNCLKMLAEGLADNGIATLRYDKRGIGESNSTHAEIDLHFDDYVNDASGLIELLRNDRRFSKIVVAGHSEGSLIGMLAIKKSPVEGFVSIAGSARNACDLLLEQLSNTPADIYSEIETIIDSLKSGYSITAVSKQLQPLFRKSVQPYLKSWFKYNPTTEIATLKCPIMILQGNNDLQISNEHATTLHKANINSKLIIIDSMNHILKKSDSERMKNLGTYFNPEIPLCTGVVESIVEFIESIKQT